MSKKRLLDLFCKAGGAARGYQLAGFYVVGVDIEPQPNYAGDEFFQSDAIEFIYKNGGEFNAFHGSPPCQVHSVLSHLARPGHLDLIPQTRQAMRSFGRPYVIENVPGAPLVNPVRLCGTAFGLQTKCGSQLRRHRLFETNFDVGLVKPCRHIGRTIGIFGDKARDTGAEKRHYSQEKETRGQPSGIKYTLTDARDAMGIDWMNFRELSQAIPPAYTEFIGMKLIEILKVRLQA